MKNRWAWWAGGFLLVLLILASGIAAIFQVGLVRQWAQSALIRGIEQRTGARVELGSFSIHPWRLEAEIDDLTLHGLEDSGSPPLFRANRVEVGLHILSLFRRRISIDKLIVERPQVFVWVDKEGHSNLPAPRRPTNAGPWRQTLFNLQVARLELNDGSAIFNDQQVPLTLRGQKLDFSLNYYNAPNQADLYIGQLGWHQVEWVRPKLKTLAFDFTSKFTLHRNSFELDELICKLPHSELDLRAELPSFAQADWNLHYRGRFSLTDLRSFLGSPWPDVSTDFSGQAHYAANSPAEGRWTASGYYKANRIRFPYQWFHANGFETWGNYEVADERLVVANLKAKALSGTLDGRLDLDFRTLVFQTETHLNGASLGAALNAVDNISLPVNPLHWDAAMQVDSVNTWQSDFKHFRSKGQSTWTEPQSLAAGKIPIRAHIDYDYSRDSQSVAITSSEISTPTAEVDMDGPLGGLDSALEVKFETSDLLPWDDFINAIRGPGAKPERVAGNITWQGRILGPIVGPTFVGHLEASDATYASFFWNQLTGDMTYSPDSFQLTNTIVRRGETSAKLNLTLQFDGNWGFVADSLWSLDGRVQQAPSDDFQAMFGTNYPVSGYISGDFRGSGTHAAPKLESNFVLDRIEAKGVRFDRLTGELRLEPDKIELSRAELSRASGRVSGSVLYRPNERDVTFDLTGSTIGLENITEIQTASMPVAGTFDFDLRGSGPIRAPMAQGDLKVVNLKLGSEMEGNFQGHLVSDGRNAVISVASDLARGKLQGKLSIGWAGDEPLSGELMVEQFDLDPFIVSGLHLNQLTKPSSADGTFKISGALRQPDSIGVDADITKISFDYEFVQLTNDQDIRISYHRNEVRIEQARLHGPDTDLVLSGSARFDRDRPLRVSLSGGVNLRLVRGLLPDLDAQGRADVSVSVEGTIPHPRVTGRTIVRDASANYADFPIGLSKVNGTLVFDKSRLVFDQITAEAGGGKLNLNGSLSYGEGPVRYEVTATTSTIRIRYPAGMSWLAGGTLQLSGTSDGAVVSGNVQVQRLLFGEGVDVVSFFAAASQTATQQVTTSRFLQNLTFDVGGQTSPGARIEWTGAEIEMDASVRLRGTWDRPVLLGNIHLLGGEMPFHGNTYELTRGDINFANPFRLDPVLNVEATSTISQYQVTIDFSGPASRLALNYRSDPPLPEADIIGLLALGRTGEETGPVSQSASQNYGATALLSEAISSGLGGRIEHLFGVSQFRVDPFVAGTATESNAAARVTIQEQIRRDLVITYSSNAATSNQYQLIQVEYQVKRDLAVQFLRDINGTYGMDIKWVKRLK